MLKPIHTLEAYINHKSDILAAPKRPPKPENLRQATYNSLLRQQKIFSSSWDIKEPFRLTLHTIANVNCDLARAIKVGVHLGLYHGERKLCAQHSTDLSISNNRTITFERDISFDIQMQNLPRMTRLCIVIYEVTTKGSRTKKSSNTSKDKDTNIYKDANIYVNLNPLAWVNTTIFDYKHQLRSGCMSLYTWTYADDIQSDEIFHPLGTIEPNPRKDECAVVQVTFHRLVFFSFGFFFLCYFAIRLSSVTVPIILCTLLRNR